MKPLSVASNRLDALKIGTKLLLAFFLVLLLTVLLGVFSMLKLAQVNQVSSDLAQKWMPSVGHTTSMRTAMLEVRELEVKHARAADAGYMDEYEEKMKAAVAVVACYSADF
jgi:methyl-accepting chemotaxis protein